MFSIISQHMIEYTLKYALRFRVRMDSGPPAAKRLLILEVRVLVFSSILYNMCVCNYGM